LEERRRVYDAVMHDLDVKLEKLSTKIDIELGDHSNTGRIHSSINKMDDKLMDYRDFINKQDERINKLERYAAILISGGLLIWIITQLIIKFYIK